MGATAAARELTRGEALPVRTVAIKGAPAGLANEIRTYANIAAGAPLLGVDLDAVSARVREHPFVSAAAARRVPPDTIEIEILARHAAALLSAGSTYLVDDAGQPFKRARPGDSVDLPVVHGDVLLDVVATTADAPAGDVEGDTPADVVLTEPAPRAVDVVAVQGALLGIDAVARADDAVLVLGSLDEVVVERGFGLTFVFSTGVRARVGNSLLDSKVARLVRVVRKLREAGHNPAEVYLDDGRRPERVAVRLRPASEVTLDLGI